VLIELPRKMLSSLCKKNILELFIIVIKEAIY